jgi:PIN domain nuclease of toxin-antitoxin system
MEIILDTHIFLWYITGDSHLTINNLNLIRDIKNTIFISPVSIWECIIKQEIGKLDLKDKAGFYLAEERERHNFVSLTFKEKDLTILHNLPDLHKDPFDKLLICQAVSNNYKFITNDKLIRQYDAIKPLLI